MKAYDSVANVKYITAPNNLSPLSMLGTLKVILRGITHHTRMKKLIDCRKMLSRSQRLIYAYSLGCTLKYWLAG